MNAKSTSTLRMLSTTVPARRTPFRATLATRCSSVAWLPRLKRLFLETLYGQGHSLIMSRTSSYNSLIQSRLQVDTFSSPVGKLHDHCSLLTAVGRLGTYEYSSVHALKCFNYGSRTKMQNSSRGQGCFCVVVCEYLLAFQSIECKCRDIHTSLPSVQSDFYCSRLDHTCVKHTRPLAMRKKN